MHEHAVQAAHAVAPGFGERHFSFPDRVVAGPARIVGADLEAGRVDEAIERVFLSLHNHAPFGDPVDAMPVCIDKGDIVPVEGGEIIVVEAGSLAELSVPGLQRLGRSRIFHDLVHPGPHLIHFPEVGQFGEFRELLRRQVSVALLRRNMQQVPDNVRPPILHEIDGRKTAGDERVEILHPLFLPARLQRFHPFRIGRPVATIVHRRRRALEHVEMLCPAGEVRHALYGGCACADNADHLVAELIEAAGTIPAGIIIVPAAGMERMTRKRLDPRNTRQFRTVQRAVGHDHILRRETVAAIGVNLPAPMILVPVQAGDFCAQKGIAVKVVVAGDTAGMLKNLRRAGILLHRHVAGLFQQRQVDIALDIARSARIAVPVPGAAEVATLLHHADIFEPRIAQPGCRQKAAETAADHTHLDMIRNRIARHQLAVGILDEMGEFAHHVHILVVPVGPQALVTLCTVLAAQGIGIVELCIVGHARFLLVFVCPDLKPGWKRS